MAGFARAFVDLGAAALAGGGPRYGLAAAAVRRVRYSDAIRGESAAAAAGGGMIQVRLAAAGLEVEFQAGQGITALYGAADAGETFILDAIAGFALPTAGRILLDDDILFDGASHVNLPPRRRHCGYVARHWALFPHMSVHDNLSFPLADLERLERHRRVKEMLERFTNCRRPRRCRPAGRFAGRAFARHGGAGDDRRAQAAPGRRAGRRYGRGPARGMASAYCGWCATKPACRCCWRRAIWRCASNWRATCCCSIADGSCKPGRRARCWISRSVWTPRGLLGIRNLFPAEIVALDPGRNTSRLRLEQFRTDRPLSSGPPARRSRVAVRGTGQLRAAPHDGSKPQANQVAARLERASEMPRAVRLEFAGGIVAEIAAARLRRAEG